jgi:predicted nuclease with TOPRIM domain
MRCKQALYEQFYLINFLFFTLKKNNGTILELGADRNGKAVIFNKSYSLINFKKSIIMSTTNFPTPAQESQPKASKNGVYKNAAIGILSAGILGLGSYMMYDKNKVTETIHQQQTQIAKVTDEKSDIQTSFDASLSRLDSMTTENTNLNSKLAARSTEISKLKYEIRTILNKKNASAAELSRAKSLIGQLNEKISSLEADVTRLTAENQTLSNDKVVLIQEKEKLTQDLTATTEVKQALEKKVDVASTLNASNIAITPIDIRKSGKEKVSTKAKRVDKLMVSFDVTNRIAQSGATDVYVVVIGPDGQPIVTGQETFTTREDGNKTYTAKLPVEIETAKRQNVEFAFAPGTKFQQGSYKILIYQNGFLIGEGVRELRKGGLFS